LSERRSGNLFGFWGAPPSARSFLLAIALLLGATGLQAEEPIRLRIVGGLAGVTQYTQLEQPFWQSEIGRRSGGRVVATIRPFDASGLRGQEMLQLMRLGVVPFGTALLSVAAGEEPELTAVDLPVLNPDMAALRRTVELYRDHLKTVLRDRHTIELIGIYAYPAQVLFCTKPFTGLGDIAGRRIRTSSVNQSELMRALGAVPVALPFADIVPAMRDGVADCAITGTLSGNEIGLADVTTHVHAMAINWGLSIFGANLAAWESLPGDIRTVLREGVADLERRIWEQADRDTVLGLACNTGSEVCPPPRRKSMTLVPRSAADESRRQQLLTDHVLPKWLERCGEGCAAAWAAYLAPNLRVVAGAR